MALATNPKSFQIITIKQLKSVIRNWREAGTLDLCPFFWGPPGGGKTAAFQQIAHEWGADFHSFLTSTMDPTDVVGVPFPNTTRGCTDFLPPSQFLELTEEGKRPEKPAIALFDDLPASTEQVFNALLGFVHGRKFGQHKIRDNVLICATGNRSEDKAGAQEIGTALANRFIHFQIQLDHEDWVEWAFDNTVNPDVIAFIRQHPDMLDRFEEALSSGEKAYATPRSVARAGRIQEALGYDHPLLMNTIAANCGDGWATHYQAFIRYRTKMVSPEEIFQNPDTCTVPAANEVDLLYATNTSLIAACKSKPTTTKCKAIAKYAMRMPHEDLGLVLAQDLLKQIVSKGDDNLRSEVCGSPLLKELREKFGAFLAVHMEA